MTDGSELAIWTPDDLLWYLDADTAQVVDLQALTYFSGSDCTGQAFVSPISVRPRVPVQIPTSGGWVVRRDEALPAQQCGLDSFRGPGAACTSLSTSTCADVLAVAEMDTDPELPDVSGFVAPLHPEPIR